MEKYLVASSGDTLESKVSGRFGHSGWFLLIDPVTMKYESFEGFSVEEDQEISRFMDETVKKVIVGNIGPGAFNELISFGCRIYLCRNMAVPEAIKKVKNGEIKPLKEPTLKSSIHSARKTGYNYGGHGERINPGGKGSELPGRGMNRGTGRGLGRLRGNKRSAGRETNLRRGTLRTR